jgi:hypothetical protein
MTEEDAPNAELLRPQMTIDQVLWECFRHFIHLDESNAAMHTAPVRYSPITFRVAEHLAPILKRDWLSPDGRYQLQQVVNHLGAYEEDKGR